MSITFTINPSSIQLSCKSLWIFDDIDLNTNPQFDLNIYIPNIDIIIKNIYLYTLNNTEKSIWFTQIQSHLYYYLIAFNVFNKISYKISKGSINKHRGMNKIKKIYPIYLYSYFIYNKYYSMYTDTKYYIKVFTYIVPINEKKLFNCRFFYKLYSFI